MTWTVTTFEEEVGLHNEGGFSQLKKKLACIKKEDSCARVHLGKRARGENTVALGSVGALFLPRDVCRGTPFASRSVPTGTLFPSRCVPTGGTLFHLGMRVGGDVHFCLENRAGGRGGTIRLGKHA